MSIEQSNSIEHLVQETVSGNVEAWRRLQLALFPHLERIVRRHRAMLAKRLANRPDDVADVITATLGRLAAADFDNLRRFLAQRAGEKGLPGRTFQRWLRGLVEYAIHDHIRERFGRRPRPGRGFHPRPSKRDLGTGAVGFDEESLPRHLLHGPGVTTKLSLAEIFAHVDATFSTLEVRAMHLYYAAGLEPAELARTLDLADAAAAERLIRRLNARLRYRFAA